MNRRTLLQDRGMEKLEELLSRCDGGELSGSEAGELLGCSERQFRRYRRRYEEDGLEGLADRRLGKASARRIAVDGVMWMVGQYESHFAGGNGKHFHEHLHARHGRRWKQSRGKAHFPAGDLVPSG